MGSNSSRTRNELRDSGRSHCPSHPSFEKMKTATQIVAARKKLGLSRKEAGKAWGISWRTIEAWEQGIHEPRGLYRERLAEIFNKK